MADVKISQLPAAGAITGAETVDLVQSGSNARTTLALIKDWLATLFGEKPGAWTTVTTFLNGWEDYAVTDASYNRVQYRKVDDRVFIRGLTKKANSARDAMFTLPVGFRPAKSRINLSIGYPGATAVMRVDIAANGQVTLVDIVGVPSTTTPLAYVVLDGLSFETA